MVADALESLSWTVFGGRGYRPPKAFRTTQVDGEARLGRETGAAGAS
jgi:hypothetical protein